MKTKDAQRGHLPVHVRTSIRQGIRAELAKTRGIIRTKDAEKAIKVYAKKYGVSTDIIWAVWRDGERNMVSR